MLTEAQAAAYRGDGYVVVPAVFTPGELDAIDREIDALLPEHGDRAGFRQGWVFDVDRRSAITRAVAEDERLLDLVGDVVRPGVAIHSTKLVAKQPHSEDVCHWHQDEAFYLRPGDASTHSGTRMSLWLPLQASDERNGCLWVVPGSHRWGLEPYVTVDHGTCRRTLRRPLRFGQCAGVFGGLEHLGVRKDQVGDLRGELVEDDILGGCPRGGLVTGEFQLQR